jgi:F-box protein, helicase, 18
MPIFKQTFFHDIHRIKMELTREQLAVINSTGNIKINAVAGSGKTTTVVEYARARPKTSKILYLAFNKTVRQEAIRKFRSAELKNVQVETAHSLAYKHIVFKNQYKIRHQGYKTFEIAELLGLKGNGEKHAEYIIANHINKFITYFCNSEKQKIRELNYLDVVFDEKARTFVTTFYDYIEKMVRLLLSKMNKGEINVTHDFYLKKFQLSNPELNYDYILFDEAQDASAVMLDIFLKQKGTKVIVGDIHQQIYGWRFAVNALKDAEFKSYSLTTSFRFNQNIADLAMGILKWKNHLTEHETFSINGIGSSTETKVKAVLARTNLGLLIKAIEYVTEKRKVKQIYFEGNINSYTYADDGASLYDVLNLYNGKNRQIKDKLIQKMRDFDELTDYIKKTEDVQLGMMVEIVKEYGNEIPAIIKEIKAKHVENDAREKAEMIFSTVHRSKGMEYDAVQLVNDFITEEAIEKTLTDFSEKANHSKLNEEINLLYVAVTRTKNSIHIPETLMPKDFSPFPNIHKMRVKKEGDKWETSTEQVNAVILRKYPDKEAYSVDKTREKYPDAYKPWTTELDDELTVMYCEGVTIRDMAKHFGRSKGAIRSRIKKLELEELYG